MIAVAFQYSGLGIILGMLLVTAVIVLCERRDHDLDADQLEQRLRGYQRGPHCTRPTVTRNREVRR